MSSWCYVLNLLNIYAVRLNDFRGIDKTSISFSIYFKIIKMSEKKSEKKPTWLRTICLIFVTLTLWFAFAVLIPLLWVAIALVGTWPMVFFGWETWWGSLAEPVWILLTWGFLPFLYLFISIFMVIKFYEILGGSEN